MNPNIFTGKFPLLFSTRSFQICAQNVVTINRKIYLFFWTLLEFFYSYSVHAVTFAWRVPYFSYNRAFEAIVDAWRTNYVISTLQPHTGVDFQRFGSFCKVSADVSRINCMYNVHIPISHVHGNISFYYIHGNSYNVGMCKTGISNTISSGFYQLKKGIFINSI